jgi:type I restriction enzyme M protein
MDKDHVVHYDTISGQIYEYFMNTYVSGGGKDLGQFFTPRKLINLMFYGLKLNDYIKVDKNTTVYDCCAGSGGFLTRIYNCFKDNGLKPENIYGNEIEKDTMKFCTSNLLLTTDHFCENVVNKDSIVYNNELQHDIILTNPPFGTSMKYETKETEYGNTNDLKFKDVYPVKTNDGACLFTQKCVHKLKQNGVCAIVLPDGQLFFGKNFKKFREWLTKSVNVHKIVQIPSGTFDTAGIKTCVILFTKDGPTKEIEFLKTDIECSYLERIIITTNNELKLNGYSFEPKDYLEDDKSNEINSSNIEWKELGELCNFHA